MEFTDYPLSNIQSSTCRCEKLKDKIIAIFILCQEHQLVSKEVSQNENTDNAHTEEDVSTVEMLTNTNEQTEKPHTCNECGKSFSKKHKQSTPTNTHQRTSLHLY